MNSVTLPRNLQAAGQIGRAGLRRAWDWWWGEMLAMLPTAAQQAISDRKRILHAAVADDTIDIRLLRSGQSTSLASFGWTAKPAAGLGHIRAQVEQSTPPFTATVVQLAEKFALQRTVTLPLEAGENLSNVLRYEMDRLTPFTEADVYFDYSVISRNRATRTIELHLTVARKSTIDEIVETLAECGVKPTLLTVSDEPFDPQLAEVAGPACNLLPYARRARSSRPRRNVVLGLAFAGLVLMAAAVALPLHYRQAALVELDDALAEAKTMAAAAGQTREEIDRVLRQNRFFATRRAELPTVVQVLDELTRLLPDDTSLIRFEVNGTRVTLQGESSSASSLIGLVESASMFHQASFSSPVTRNPRTNKDRFTLEAELVGQDGDT